METRSLHPLFAAELLGADLREPPSREFAALVDRAVDEYAVPVIRDQQIGDEEHIRFSRAFGPLELPPNLGLRNVRRRLRRELYDASNLDENGEILVRDSLRRTYNRGNELFHTDSSFNDLPTKWSLLLSHELPPGGGDTDFVDTRMHRAGSFDDLRYRRDVRRTTVNEHGEERASTERIAPPADAGQRVGAQGQGHSNRDRA